MFVLGLTPACVPRHPAASEVSPTLAKADADDALAIYDGLEQLVADSRASEKDRVFAYERVKGLKDDGTAGYAFARGALAGRVAELRGANAGGLVTESERWGRTSLERDPSFRDRAATRMLGSLYVMAPARLLEHGDSEDGLEMLEALVAELPDDPGARLRLGQAYVQLGDDDPAKPHLCAAKAARGRLRADEAKLLDALLREAGGGTPIACDGE